MPALHGNNFQKTKPTIVLNGNANELGTVLRPLGEYISQYVNEPEVTKPCTVTMTIPTGCVVHYTFGPQYPTAKVDNISCFQYTTGFSLTNNKGQDGTTIFAVAFEKDSSNKPLSNPQSNVVIAKFKIDK